MFSEIRVLVEGVDQVGLGRGLEVEQKVGEKLGLLELVNQDAEHLLDLQAGRVAQVHLARQGEVEQRVPVLQSLEEFLEIVLEDNPGVHVYLEALRVAHDLVEQEAGLVDEGQEHPSNLHYIVRILLDNLVRKRVFDQVEELWSGRET